MFEEEQTVLLMQGKRPLGSSKLGGTEAETKSYLPSRPSLFYNLMFPLEGSIRVNRPENGYRTIVVGVDLHILFADCEAALELLTRLSSQSCCSINDQESRLLRAPIGTDTPAVDFSRSLRFLRTDPQTSIALFYKIARRGAHTDRMPYLFSPAALSQYPVVEDEVKRKHSIYIFPEISHLNDTSFPFMTDAVARVRKPLPYESLDRVLATHFYMQRDIKKFDEFDPNLLASDRYITSEERSQAPILAFLEMRKLNGNRQDVEHPGFVGSKYIGDLQTPSEIGIATLDLRRCFTAIDDSWFLHAKSPGVGGQDWAFDRRLLERRYLVCVEDLATDAGRRGHAGPASMGAFSKSEFITRRNMMGHLIEILRGSIMQGIRGHAGATHSTTNTQT